MCVCVCVCVCVLYRGKEKIHSEIEIIIYQLKWYSPTSIISLALLVFRPTLVLLLTDVLQSYLSSSLFASASSVLKRHGDFYTSAIPEVTWYESLNNIYIYIYIYTH